MRRFLLQMALFLVFGGWCASASAAWDLTNQIPITKSEGLRDGMVVYFRGQCNASSAQMVLDGDFGYTNAEVKEKHLFKLVSAGNSEISGEPMFYTQNVASGMWFSGSTDGWTVENMEESTPLVIGKASLWTLMEMKNPTDPTTNSGYNVQQWVDAGGQEHLADIDIFANETKIQVWKWRPSQLNAEDGDALTLGSFDSDYVPGSGIATGFRSIANVWGSAFGYTECWWQNGGTGINPWYAYEAIEVEDPIGDLEALLRDYQDDHLDYKCKAGTDPGCLIDQSVYTKYVEKYQEATDFVQGDDLSDERAEQLFAELKAAREALLKAPRVELTEGLYYITSANWKFEENQQFTGTAEDGSEINQGKVKAMYDRENDILGWADWYKEVTVGDFKRIEKKTDAAYIFRVTKSKTVSGRWDIQNAGTGRFLNGGTAKTTAVITTPQEVMTQEAPANGIFGIRNNGGADNTMYHCAEHKEGAGVSGSLTTWSFTGASTWNFVPVTDQALIDSLNPVMDQKILDNRLKNEIASAEETMKPGYLALITDTLQLSANVNEPSEGALKNLIDGNTTTYYHSAWSIEGADEDHYLQIDLPEAVSKVAVDWYKRTQNHANRPAQITVWGQKVKDGEWTEAAVMPAEGDTLPWGSATPEYIKEVSLNGGPYTALRFEVNKTYTAAGDEGPSKHPNNHPYFTFSEFQLYNGLNADGTFQYRPSSLAYREDVKPAYEALQKAVATAKATLGATTEQDIEDMKAAIKAFDAAYPDTSILDYVINKAKTFYEQAIPADGDETLLGGYNTEELYEALNTTVEAAEADYNKETVTRAYIDEHTAAIQKAIDDFVADVNKPKMGTWYFIKSVYNGTDREDNSPFDQLIYAGGKSIGDGIKWGGDTYQGMNDATYLWRFNDLGDGTFSVENFGTGYYMGANRGTSAQYLLSDTAVAFKFGYVAGMELTLEDANYNPDAKDYRYIHAAAGNNLVTWEAHQYSPSSWTFVEATDEAAPQLLGKAGGMNIITLPFDVATTGEFTDVLGDSDSKVEVYTLANAVLDGEGKVAQLTLNPLEIPVGGIKAGTPFIIAFPEEANEDGNGVVGLNVDLEAPLSVQATTVNGVVGLLSKDTIKVNGMGYFAGDSHELVAAKKNTVINSQFGYINPKLITNEEAQDGSIVIGIKNGGVLDNIQEAIKDANALVNVVDMSGVIIRTNVKKANALKGLPKGIYIVGGQKVSVK